MSLQEEIDAKSKEIFSDGYPMSIGEIISLYKEGDIDIHPEFQRFYRWNHLQKTKLIESILLGIPIPSIFVSQREDGVWDVIDGLQRLSTIFEFLGILKNEKGETLPPLELLETDYLPSLKEKLWESENEEKSFTNIQRRLFKRQKIDIKIVNKESDKDTKYELFQRLNTGGTALSSQEVRNCLLVMINKEFYYWIKELGEYQPFLNCISISEKLKDEQFHLELLLRFFAYKNSSSEELKRFKDLDDFITSKMIEFTKEGRFNKEKEEKIFKNTFNMLNNTLGEDSFKRYNSDIKRFQGQFLISAFEVIAIGIGCNLGGDSKAYSQSYTDKLTNKIKNLWTNKTFRNNSGSGSNAKNRLPKLIPLGKELFKL
ncbi:DUF262 domain-containing protein [Pseudalkalibacillus sp. SCS-8]|uniref:DUF262 domain-containing protein n=1 Tax=Pseudalkalibacillus nanhaiensis TaxID=3115291 RepID=UPI0032D9B675